MTDTRVWKAQDKNVGIIQPKIINAKKENGVWKKKNSKKKISIKPKNETKGIIDN